MRLVGRVIDHAPRDAFVPDTSDAAFDHPLLAVALGELDESDCELIRLWAWEQLEPREIAAVLDTTPNAVSLRLTRVRKRIASSIERQDRVVVGQEGRGHARELRK